MNPVTTEPGGWYRGDTDDQPYLDWSSWREDGSRHIELGDGVNAVVVEADSEDLPRLLGELGNALAMAPDSATNTLVLANGDRITWASSGDGTFHLQLSDNTTDVAVDLTTDELQDIHEQLAEDLGIDIDE